MIGNVSRFNLVRILRFGANNQAVVPFFLFLALLRLEAQSYAQPPTANKASSSKNSAIASNVTVQTQILINKYVVNEKISTKGCSVELAKNFPEDLHERIYRNLPRDLEKLNKLKPENLATYRNTQFSEFFNPEHATTRADENVLRVIQNINLKWTFDIHIQCEAGLYRWRGIARDEAMISRLLKCREQGIAEDQAVVCNPSLGSEDARRHGTVFAQNFSDEEVKLALRELFIQFLSGVVLRVDHDKEEFLPNSNIEPFLSLTVPEDEEGSESSSTSSMQIRYDIFELPDEQADTLCMYPSRIRWRRKCLPKQSSQELSSDNGPRRIYCDIVPVNDERLNLTGQSILGAKVKISAPPYISRILIRAVGYNSTGQIQQTPTAYRCFSVRPPLYFIGVSISYGFPYDINSNAADSSYPSSALLPSAFGMQIEAGGRVPSYVKKSRWLSAGYLGGAISFSTIQGNYPCPSRQYPDCQDPLVAFRSPTTSSTSSAIDLRVVTRADLLRFSKLSILIAGDIGFGIEYLGSSGTPFRNDGWHGLFASRVGLGLSVMHGFAGRLSVRAALLASLETRVRLRRTFVTETSNIYRTEAAGVPDGMFTVWISYLTHFYFSPKAGRYLN